MKNQRIRIYDDVEWAVPRVNSFNEMLDALMKVFKYWCNMHPRERCRTSLKMMIKDSKIKRTPFYDLDEIINKLPEYMDHQFRLEKLVGEWYLVYDPKFKPIQHKIKDSGFKRSPVPGAMRHEVFKRDGYRCVECGATNQDVRLHVDHIVPVSQGGSNELDNLQTLCQDCNLAKSNRAWKGGNHD